jgi:outer membrane protein assembly factor BamB
MLALVAGLCACSRNDTIEPPAELVELDPTQEVRMIWRQKVGRGFERLRLGLSPAIDEQTVGDRGPRVFVGAHEGKAAALDLVTGEEIWAVDTRRELAAGPAYGEGAVVLGTSDGGLLALDAGTGDELWHVPVGSEVLAPPAIGGGAVIFRTTDGRINAASIASGAELWSVTHTLPVLTLRGNSAPLVVGELAVAGFDNGRVGAYQIATGSERWSEVLAAPAGRTEIDRLVDVGTDIEVFGRDVYAATYQGRAGSFDLTTGTPYWQREMSSFVGLGVDSEHAYVTNDVGTVIALTRGPVNGGVEVWRQEALRMREVTAATRFRDTVVVGDFEGYLHFLDAGDGSFVARIRAGSGQIRAKPLAVGPRLIVQSDDGMVAAFEIVDEAD